MAQIDNAALADNFMIGAYNEKAKPDDPTQKGVESAMADYAEKARTAAGRQALVDELGKSGMTNVLARQAEANTREASGLGDKDSVKQAQGYSQGEAQIFVNLQGPERRQDLADYAQKQAEASGKPFEPIGKNEAWASKEEIALGARSAEVEPSQARGRPNLELEIGGAPNMSGAAVSKMIDRIDQGVQSEGKGEAPARRREDAMER